MQIDKAQTWSCFERRARTTRPGRLDSELPQQVDTEQHAGLLEKLGLDPADVVTMLAGGSGGAGRPLGGLNGTLGR